MRFLVLFPFFTFGGAEKQATALAYSLLDEGHDVEAWAFPAPLIGAPLRAEMESRGIRCFEFLSYPRLDLRDCSQKPFYVRVKRRLCWWWQVRQIVSQAPRREFEVVVPFTFLPSLIAVLLRKRLRASQVVWNHRGGYDEAGIDYSRFLVSTIKSSSPIFVANSKDGVRFLRDKFGIGPISYIPNFVCSGPDYSPARARQELQSGDECRLVHIANCYPEKDFDTLLYAMQELAKTGKLYRLHLAGSFPVDGDECAFFEKVRAMGLSACVIHHGPLVRSAICGLLETCHIGILSTRSEGCPNSVIEYMQFGLPVVGTNIPGIRDLVGEEGVRYLFPVGDFMQMSRQVKLLAEAPELCATVGQRNKERIANEFSARGVFDRWLSIFEDRKQERGREIGHLHK